MHVGGLSKGYWISSCHLDTGRCLVTILVVTRMSLFTDLTWLSGRELDDKGLPHERVRPTGLAAVIVGVALEHRHHVLPGGGEETLNNKPVTYRLIKN